MLAVLSSFFNPLSESLWQPDRAAGSMRLLPHSYPTRAGSMLRPHRWSQGRAKTGEDGAPELRAALWPVYAPWPETLEATLSHSPGWFEILWLDPSSDLCDLLPETPENKYRKISRLSSMKGWVLKGMHSLKGISNFEQWRDHWKMTHTQVCTHTRTFTHTF